MAQQRNIGNSDKSITAVEWLIEQISEKQPNGFYVIDTLEDVKRVFEQAKQMEKEQITSAYQTDRRPCSDEDAEQYYNETYGEDSNESNA